MAKKTEEKIWTEICPDCKGKRVIKEWRGTNSEREIICGQCHGHGKIWLRPKT